MKRSRRALLRDALIVALLTVLALALAYQVRSPVVIDVGGSRDAPFLYHFQDAEHDAKRTYRWTQAQSQVQLAGQALPAPWTLRVRLYSYRPDREAEVQLAMNGIPVKDLALRQEWFTYTLQGIVPADALTGDNALGFSSDTFIPKEEVEGNTDPRALGVATDWIELTPVRSDTFIGNDDAWLDLRMAPVIPPPFPLASWGFAVALLYVSARGIGLPRRGVNLAFALLIFALALGVAFLRPFLGNYSAPFLNLAIGLALFALSLVLLLPSLAAHLQLELSARSLTSLSAIILVSAGLVWGGAGYSQFHSSDLAFHAHRLAGVAEGNLFFTSELPDAARRVVPYPPALYIVLTPFAPLTDDYSALLLVFNVLADAVAILAVYFGARKALENTSSAAGAPPTALGSSHAALFAAFLFAFNPVAFWIFSWGNHTNIFGQSAATLLFVVVLTQPLTRPRNFMLALFLLLLASTAHLGVFLSLLVFFPLVILFRLIARDAAARRETLALILLLAVGVVLGWVLYYGEFTADLVTQSQKFVVDFGAGRASDSGGVTLARAGDVARYTAEQLGWVLLLVGIAGVPLAWRQLTARARSVWGAWLLVGVVFGLVTLGAAFSTRYTLWAAPALALSGGLALAWLLSSGRALQWTAHVLCAFAFGQTVWLWVDRVLNVYH